MIYLASPYSHADELVREGRYREACKHAAMLMSDGEIVFSPIAHSHPIAIYLPSDKVCDFDFWMEQDLPILAACDDLYVLMLAGWEKSRGVAREIEFARQSAIPTTYIEP